MKKASVVILLFLFVSSSIAAGIPSPYGSGKPDSRVELMSSSTFSGLTFRSIGPALTSGRVGSIAVDPNNRAHYYVGVASGGVWETTNDGTSWTPVFEHEPSYSIGAVAIDPKNPFVVWVGTGENNSQRSVGYGDGIYRSNDGGKTWRFVGLKKSEHIGKILIDPENPNVIFVAAQGPLWSPGGDRGLFKSTDDGNSWRNVLDISENTGVTDVVADPADPEVMYAASYQRRRHVWGFIDGGPESAIYKSTDTGESWHKLTAGLPETDMGKIGLAVSPVYHNVVYATIEAAEGQGGIYRSTDYGESWEKRNGFDEIAMYYATIYCDPVNVDRIYIMNTYVMVSDDGGKTLHRLNEKWKHVDSHVMYIDPKDPDYYLVGCDGGLYESYDRALNWNFKSNLPVTQFYDITVDKSKPFYYVYGGTQDNFSLGGPSRTVSASGIVNSDWFVTTGGDGFQSRVDPADPNTIYAESQYGGLVRFDRKTGQQLGIQPQQGKDESPLRWQWDSPLLISPFSHTRLYFAGNKLFRSDNRGDSWTEISGDLTRQIDVNKLKIMGKTWNIDAVAKNASTTFYGTCTTITESPLKEGLIYVGTDDGLIQVTEDGGKTWTKIDKFPGVPDMTYVSRVVASMHDVNTVYAVFDNHKNGDFKPYILKSTDMGRNWSSISSNLPDNGPVLSFAEDFEDGNLMFAGTEFGVFFSNDDGREWTQLKGGMPTIPVRDIAIARNQSDLVCATFGRGIYILDDYSPLRTADDGLLSEDATLFPVRNTLMYVQSQPLGGDEKSFQGENYYSAPNPPYGAIFTYYLKESLKTKKEKRQDLENADEKKGIVPPYPTPEELTAEGEEFPPSVDLVVTDDAGNVVRKLDAPMSSGFHRVAWDLTYPDMLVPQREDVSGPRVMPGNYTVTLYSMIDGHLTRLSQPQGFTVFVEGTDTMTAPERTALVAFQDKVTRLNGAVNSSLTGLKDLKDKLKSIGQALMQAPSNVDNLRLTADSIETSADSILIALRGNQTLRNLNQNTPISISERIGTILGNEALSTSAPPETDLDSYEIAAEEFTVQLARLKYLVDVELKQLEEKMVASGCPLTPGRIPEWKKDTN